MASDTSVLPGLALGTATLMRRPSSSGQLRILELAYDLGVRHFDTAPLYGFGGAEALLRKFKKPDALITTKVGRSATWPLRASARAQAPVRAALRAMPALRAKARRSGLAQPIVVRLRPGDATRSLKASLARMGRPDVAVLSLHDVPISAVTDDLLQELHTLREEGLCAAVGFAVSFSDFQALPAQLRKGFDVAQLPLTQDWVAHMGASHRSEVTWSLHGLRLFGESLASPGSSPLQHHNKAFQAVAPFAPAARCVVGTTHESHLHELVQAYTLSLARGA